MSPDVSFPTAAHTRLHAKCMDRLVNITGNSQHVGHIQKLAMFEVPRVKGLLQRFLFYFCSTTSVLCLLSPINALFTPIRGSTSSVRGNLTWEPEGHWFECASPYQSCGVWMGSWRGTSWAVLKVPLSKSLNPQLFRAPDYMAALSL